MSTKTKNAQATLSEFVMNGAQPRVSPAKRAKKWQVCAKVEPVCASVSRSLQRSDIPDERQTSIDTELDIHHALFGSEGQIMMPEHPRHYDIFQLYRDTRIRGQKQQEDTHNNLFGDTFDTPLSRPASQTSDIITHDRLFGEYRESSEGESTTQSHKNFEVSQELQTHSIWSISTPGSIDFRQFLIVQDNLIAASLLWFSYVLIVLNDFFSVCCWSFLCSA